MSDDKPNPVADVLKGLGLIFRAAKTTVEKLPTKDLEQVVVTSAREVGRAIENVAATLEREVFGRKRSGGRADDEAAKSEEPHEPQEPQRPQEPKPPDKV
jgi:hypothetical protein